MLKKVNNKSWKSILLIGFILILVFGALNYTNINKNTNESEKNYQPLEESVEIGCNRTSRLENKPAFDRALSLIEERYKMWEESGENIGSWYFFPSQLVNCIQIVEEDLNNNSGLEGYFIFNGEDIKNNYFPIVVDKGYKYSDESVNSLLLVHEITHVHQYLNSLNNNDELSCIDKEVDAFYAQFKFYGIQFSESRKSIDLRIENDEDLHPQLQMISEIKNLLFETFKEFRDYCLYGDGKNDKNCVDDYRKKEIKDMLLKNDYYKEQCKI